MRAALRVEMDTGEGSGVLGVGIEMEAFAFGAAKEDRRQFAGRAVLERKSCG
jgi:hypothetical protein